MISLQRSMHSSQMYTPGPAMSFLTCFWLLPQNEHFSRSPPSPMRAMVVESYFLLAVGRRPSDTSVPTLPARSVGVRPIGPDRVDGVSSPRVLPRRRERVIH